MQIDTVTDISQAVRDLLNRVLEHEHAGATGLATRFAEFDELTGGLTPGTLTVIGGRPSMGKTALANSMASRMVAPGRFENDYKGFPPIPVAYFTPNQNYHELTANVLGSWSGIGPMLIRRGTFRDHQCASLLEAAEALQDVPLYINRSVVNFDALRIALMHLVYGKGVRVVFIDNVHNMPILSRIRDVNGEELRLEQALRSLAVEFNIAVVCLSNIARPPEDGPYLPRLSDLDEYGTFGHDADIVALLHREYYYRGADIEWHDDPLNDQSRADLLIHKNIGGPTGTVSLRWDEQAWRFEDYSYDVPGPCFEDDPSIPI